MIIFYINYFERYNKGSIFKNLFDSLREYVAFKKSHIKNTVEVFSKDNVHPFVQLNARTTVSWPPKDKCCSYKLQVVQKLKPGGEQKSFSVTGNLFSLFLDMNGCIYDR